MTAWWGLVGLAGLPGIFGLIRARMSSGRDPLERYPVAREPAVPNADAAHTPLMTPRVTPDMLHHDGGQGMPGPATKPVQGAVPQARAGDHDSPVPAANTARASAEAAAAIRPEAPPSAGRLRQPGAPKESSPGGSVTRESVSGERVSQSVKPQADRSPAPVKPQSDRPPAPEGWSAGSRATSPESERVSLPEVSHEPRPVARTSEPSTAPEPSSEDRTRESDAELVPTQPFTAQSLPADDDRTDTGTLTGDLAPETPKPPAEPQSAGAGSTPSGPERSTRRRLGETARRLAASAAQTVQDRRGQFTRIFRKGNSR